MTSQFEVRFAQSEYDVIASYRLRYDVFVSELGATPSPQAEVGLEHDDYDQHARHLLLFDLALPKDQQVIGTYRLIANSDADPPAFSSAPEYNLEALNKSGKTILELSRSCIHRDYRNGQAMFLLWQALAKHIQESEVQVLFGVASFHGTKTTELVEPLSLLHRKHLAPSDLRPISKVPAPFELLQHEQINRKSAMLKLPALIKAYLRLGGMVGDGAFVDHAFNTVDVCMVLDMDRVTQRQRSIYLEGNS